MSRILNVKEAAELLGCAPDTLRTKTPKVVPGTKFGSDWVYSEALLLRTVEKLSLEAQNGGRPVKKDFFQAHGFTKDSAPSLNP